MTEAQNRNSANKNLLYLHRGSTKTQKGNIKRKMSTLCCYNSYVHLLFPFLFFRNLVEFRWGTQGKRYMGDLKRCVLFVYHHRRNCFEKSRKCNEKYCFFFNFLTNVRFSLTNVLLSVFYQMQKDFIFAATNLCNYVTFCIILFVLFWHIERANRNR